MMPIRIIKQKLSLADLKKLARERFGDLVKAVVDIEKEIMAIGGDLHTDEEALLIEQGSKQKDLWGINIYPNLKGEEMIEFDSVINIRPAEGNLSRFVENKRTRDKITKTVDKLIER